VVIWLGRIAAPLTRQLSKLRAKAIELTGATGVLGWAIGGVLIAGGSAVLFALPFPITAVAVITVGLAILVGGSPIRIGMGHVLACLLVVGMSGITDTTRNYYRFWGGSARRLGDLDTAVASYQKVIEIAPDWPQGHTSLGNLYRRQKKFEDAIKHFNKASWLADDDFRPQLGLALTYTDMGDGGNAYAAAVEALERKPGNRQATTIRDRYQAQFGGQ
jgi:hypothetical protein